MLFRSAASQGKKIPAELLTKDATIREIHHRVKNNLQLIASIMNMQMRQTRTAEAKGVLRGVQERIMSLATIHKSLYQTTGLSDIRANELLADIIRQTLRMATGPGKRINVSTDFDAISLTPDQAVPLSLLLTEAMTPGSRINVWSQSTPAAERAAMLAAASRTPGWAAGALAEGATSAGQNIEQVRQGTKDGLLTGEQIGIVGASGAITAGITAVAGRIAPTSTTGLSLCTTRFKKYAVSSRVSVP